ncbi:MAG: hypothetical protein RL638_268 [Bacteroidota bacterium]|jgi:hypothetical protein
MFLQEPSFGRELKLAEYSSDLVVVGGGLAGVCAAISAARSGLQVALIQDRPVLGGNSSSEVRLWILGATSHMGNNNRWARESGVINEIMVENLFANKEGNPIIFDSILLDKVRKESNISLFLNTSIYHVEKADADTISSVVGYCSQNETKYKFSSSLFVDCSGDGIVGFLSGAAFRMGAESQDEFGEKFAPSIEYGELLGHSIYFYSKDTGQPVKYVAPSFAIDVSKEIPRYKSFNSQDFGCRLWWIEYGGRKDTIHDTEEIKWELWKIVYGVWNHIKNSGEFPDAENLTLEWVGMIPGKRESRRFEGDYMMVQQDIVEQRKHSDAVAFGGWSIDLHPGDGVFSEKPGCNQWHSKGLYQVPYRSLYSKNISNLFFAGRIISASHVAFGSTRVMATSAYLGQVVGHAAYLCLLKKCKPRDLYTKNHMEELQLYLAKNGQFIPDFHPIDNENLINSARIEASSQLQLSILEGNNDWKYLDESIGQLLPIKAGKIPDIKLTVFGVENTILNTEVRLSSKVGNFTPDQTLSNQSHIIVSGKNEINIHSDAILEADQYVFFIIHKNSNVKIEFTETRITGLLSVFNTVNAAVSNYGKQDAPDNIGIDSFEFWVPQRRPDGKNLALQISEPLNQFNKSNLTSLIQRPTNQTNAWVADLNDDFPEIRINWESKQEIKQIILCFDPDWDHPLETVLINHPESVIPFTVQNYTICDDEGILVFEKSGNYETINNIRFENSINTRELVIRLKKSNTNIPVSLFSIQIY